MSEFILSFDEGDTIALAINRKTNKIVHEIKIRRTKENLEPDIEVDDIFDILNNEDLRHVKRLMKLTEIELKILKLALKDRTSKRLNNKLTRAYDLTMDILESKLKKELEFDDSLFVIPAYGYKDVPFDRHMFISGASGSGKSVLVSKILEFDKRKRPIMLISKVNGDKAFDVLDKMNKKNKKNRFFHFTIEGEDDLLKLPQKDSLIEDSEQFDGVVVLFDDIDTFDKETTAFLREYMNDLLETGRHDHVSVIATSHRLKNYSKTKTNLAEAEFVALFPSSNQMLSNKFLKDSMGLLKLERERIISKASKNRYMILKTSHPILVIHQTGIILL